MANTRGSAVRRWASTTTKPRASRAARVCSSPRSSVTGRRPTATSSWSTSRCVGAPSPASSTVTSLPASRIPVSLVPSRICLNCFPSRRASGRHQVPIDSRQHPVEQLHDRDLAPERRVDAPELEPDVAAAHHQEPRRRGGQLERRGRVPHAGPGLEPGKRRGPRARGDDRVLELERRRRRVLPRHADRAVASRSARGPCTTSTPRALASAASPWARRSMDRWVQARSFAASTRGGPNVTPASAAAAASWISAAMPRSAFEGMQPTWRHSPPSAPRASTRTVSSPRSAARKAAA